MMFESFNVSGLYIAEQPVAALYAVGKVTGVSVDVGYSVTDVAPVVEGSVVSPAAQRCEAGHSLVTAELLARCGETHGALREHEKDAVRDATAAVAPSEDDASAALKAETYTLPDGRKVSVPGPARRECVESGLFRPSGRAGLVDAVEASITACSWEQRRAVVDAVAVCGAWAGRTEGLDARMLTGPGAAATPVDEADVGRSAGVHATGDGTVGSMDGRGDPLQGCVHAQPARD